VRFGVVGTSYWAKETHARGIAQTPGAELVGIWGRDAARCEQAASEVGTRPFGSFAELLANVDAVSFSVPPDVQAELATQAARVGKHLMLEKPLALDVDAARALESAVHQAGVASVVFFTATFTPERAAWMEQLRAGSYDRGAAVLFLASAFAPGSPFDTPWRHEKGALWDVGPHILAALTDALGPVASIAAAARGEGDLVHVVCRHESGATSTATATLRAAPAAFRVDVQVWGDDGVVPMTRSSQPAAASLSEAVTQLMRSAATDARHPRDVSFGRHIVELLGEAERMCAADGR
jgi:predicted dehydrogenase